MLGGVGWLVGAVRCAALLLRPVVVGACSLLIDWLRKLDFLVFLGQPYLNYYPCMCTFGRVKANMRQAWPSRVCIADVQALHGLA